MTYTAWFDEIRKDDIALAGGKAANLGELSRAGLPVPPGYVVTTTAYDTFVEANGIGDAIVGRTLATRADDPASFEEVAEGIRALFSGGKVPEEMGDEIRAAYQQLGEDALETPVAVRSSATAEDLPAMSFAVDGASDGLPGTPGRRSGNREPGGGGPEDGRVGSRWCDVHRQPLKRTPGSGDDKRRMGVGGICGKRLGDAGFYRRGEGERARAFARDRRQRGHDGLCRGWHRGEACAGGAAQEAGSRRRGRGDTDPLRGNDRAKLRNPAGHRVGARGR